MKVSNPVAPVAADLPSDKELVALRDLCGREFPSWVNSDSYVFGRTGTVTKEQNDAAWLSMFSSSLLAISQMRMLDKPDKKYFVTHFIDVANDLLRKIRKPVSELRSAPFTMAAMCLRVPVSGLGISGSSISLGLSQYVGKPVDPSAWRETLRAGRLPAQHPVETRIPPQGRVEIAVNGGRY